MKLRSTIAALHAALLALLLAVSPALSGSMTLLGVGKPSAVVGGFQGPGDIVSGATVFYSCARVYNAAGASTSTSLCDLVDSAAPTVVICVLRGSSTGFVDLVGGYCTGSLTPSAKCAAATGGSCLVSKVYNQVSPGTLDLVQLTPGAQPTLTFSSLSSLPGMTFAGAQEIVTTGNIGSTTEPYVFSSVAKRSGNTSAFNTLLGTGDGASPAQIGFSSTANNAYMYAGSAIPLAAATDLSFHAFNDTFNTGGGTSAFYIDGSATSAALTVSRTLSEKIHLGADRGDAGFLTGVVMEAGIWPLDFTVSSRNSNMNTNQHSATSGYNF